MPPIEKLLEALQRYGYELTKNFSVAEFSPAQAEDQLKGPTQTLLQQVGSTLGFDVVARTEAKTELGVRPDIGVTVGKLVAGHVELKAPGKGVRPKNFASEHDRDQFKKLKDHPNLVYADGNAWALYRKGELVGSPVVASGDIRSDGLDAYSAANASALEVLLRDFFGWEPIVPTTPRALAETLAPLTRLLRESVRTALVQSSSALAHLRDEWRDVFFPDADDAQFSDSYAQTLTYALLLARVEGVEDLHAYAAEQLDKRHALLAQVLRVLAEPSAREEVAVPVDLLERTIEAVQPEELAKRSKGDMWLYFYEDFLAAYDPKLRKQRGVYFTPTQVVHAQTRLVAELLRDRFDEPLGFASESVTVLDPAVGTGTYLLAAMQAGAQAVRDKFGEGAVPGRASVMAENFHGFELLVGSYSVAHLRISQEILSERGALPADGVHVYLTDTLESPHNAEEAAQPMLFYKKLAEEHERARKVKADVRVVVCIGNPPYFRQVIEEGEEGVERQGGWVRYGDDVSQPIFVDFLRDAPPIDVKNLYNLYVYFWRWALWKVFENGPDGIVSFITASSYLRGPGFAGMRKFMRETLDELWILDLGGEGRGARKSENVFAIQTPVAIAVAVRRGERKPDDPAQVWYARVDGTQEEKFAALDAIERFDRVDWQACFNGWTEPFLPVSQGDFFSWPSLTDLFPWQHSGVQFKRTWPIAPDRGTLIRRWNALLSAPAAERAELLRETRDRKADRVYSSLTDGEKLPSLAGLDDDTPPPPPVRYAYRTLDRQFCLADNRLGDFLRPALWKTLSPRQLFIVSFLTGVLGEGPAAAITTNVPDMDYFRGSYGAKHVIPLWRDEHATRPNVTAGLLDLVAADAEGLFAYCYAVLSAPSYTARFESELEIPGPHIPLTRSRDLFDRATHLGRRLIWLHTYGERFVAEGERAGEVPSGVARCTRSVPEAHDDYPIAFTYDEAREELHIGAGTFAPVAPAVRRYNVSGLDVIGSWLDYRMRDGAGKQSSYLNRLRPLAWSADFTEELLRLLWIIEHTVALGPELDDLLELVISSELFHTDELPSPTDDERKPPN